MAEKISVIVIDDHAIFRTGVIQTLAGSQDLQILGEGASLAEAIELAERTRPDVALVDVSMPGGGIAAARSIHASWPEIRVVMLTISEDEDVVLQALDAGASAYALKGVPGSELIAIIRSVAQGASYVPPNIAARLLNSMRTRLDEGAIATKITALTIKERRTLRLLSQGFSNRAIADATGVTVPTVKFHVSNIFSKIGIKNRVEATLAANKYLLEE